jgi:hypothetical protein
MKSNMRRRDITTKIVLEAAVRASLERRMMTWEYIHEATGAPEKVIYAAMQREDDRGYLDWGVSLRTAWITKEGKAKLAEILNY